MSISRCLSSSYTKSCANFLRHAIDVSVQAGVSASVAAAGYLVDKGLNENNDKKDVSLGDFSLAPKLVNVGFVVSASWVALNFMINLFPDLDRGQRLGVSIVMMLAMAEGIYSLSQFNNTDRLFAASAFAGGANFTFYVAEKLTIALVNKNNERFYKPVNEQESLEAAVRSGRDGSLSG